MTKNESDNNLQKSLQNSLFQSHKLSIQSSLSLKKQKKEILGESLQPTGTIHHQDKQGYQHFERWFSSSFHGRGKIFI